MKRTRMGALLAAGLVVLAFASTAFAEQGHPVPISDTSVSVDCTGGPDGSSITPGAGQVAWLFVHNQVEGPGTLTVVFDAAGTKTASSFVQGTLKYVVVTPGSDTISNFYDNLSGGQLVLSHVCYGPTPTVEPTPTPTVEPTPTPVPTSTPRPFIPTPPPTATPTAQPTATPQGSVLAETGRPQVTPPATDSVGGGSDSAGGGLGLLLLALAGLAGGVLALTPAASRKRR